MKEKNLIKKVRETDTNILENELNNQKIDKTKVEEINENVETYLNDRGYFYSILRGKADYNSPTGDDKIRLSYYFYYKN